MAKDAIYSGTRQVRTYVDLRHTANVMLGKAEEDIRGSHHTIMASILFTAFTFEAYLNHIGEQHLGCWGEKESIRVLDKYKTICEALGLKPDWSQRPYQTLKLLFKFRNSIAHGKSKEIKKTKVVSRESNPHEHAPKTFIEEQCSIPNSQRFMEDIDTIVKEIHISAGLGDYPYVGGVTVATLSLDKRAT